MPSSNPAPQAKHNYPPPTAVFYLLEGTEDQICDWVSYTVEKQAREDPQATQQALSHLQWTGAHLFDLCTKFPPFQMEQELRELGFDARLAKAVREELVARFQICREDSERRFREVCVKKVV